VRVALVPDAASDGLRTAVADWFAAEFARKCRLPVPARDVAIAKARAAALASPEKALTRLRELSEKRRNRRRR
jgi:hypothetical protein